MNLLLDIGNTGIKWATWDGVRLGTMGSARHFGGLPIDLLANWEQLPPPCAVLLAGVGPPAVVTSATRACESLWQCQPRVIATSAASQGVRIAYADPARLGVDRFLALIGAHHLTDGPKLIIDAGTAVTYDLLLTDGTHLGGAILPGIGLMRESLLTRTHIPHDEPVASDRAWAADTAGAIAAASIQAPAALAERLHQRLAERGGSADQPVMVLLTGGDAERLLPAIALPVIHQPDLVLQGLSRFAMPPAPA
ncbi:MAG: type III pantothenate kinase [Chromatiaceae bacterium]|nr:MAG: type III pantothenate kinase [Chromatiaceae bacterium]